ncbi:MAG: flagellar basal body-associated FliL family protein [Rhodanobacter sp.]
MAEADEELVQAPPPPKKKSRLPMIIGLVVVLLALGGGGFAYKAMHAKAAAKDAKAAPKAELYLPLDPPFVVNFRDDESLRYLQVGVTLMSHDADALAAAKAADPVIRDALVSLFSSQEYSIISNTAGRDKLQAQALEAVRKVVQARLGRPGVDALYFTSFVMQ